MKSAFISDREPSINRSSERGVTMALVAVAMVAIIAMAALSIDVVTLYLANAEAQRSADAAALTAARILSLTGMTGDPNNSSSQWVNICGGATSPASEAAKAVATQNTVGGLSPTVTVMYAAGGVTNADCSTLGAAFGVNPTVTVRIQRSNLPTFFARIWSRNPSSVSASATAEAFNPSNSGNVRNDAGTGQLVPVQLRCVKPWVVPNLDPGDGTCGSPPPPGRPACNPFVGTSDGSIQNKGIQFGGTTGVIGERFTMVADCQPSGKCAEPGNPASPPQANVTGPPTPNILYVPSEVTSPFTAVPSCASATDYQQAVGGCDQNTPYHCGDNLSKTTVDVSQINISPDTTTGGQCLINERLDGTGQDNLDTSTFPYRIKAGDNSVLKNTGVGADTFITSSNSIVTVPIFDSASESIDPIGTAQVTIVGFLQVFINNFDPASAGRIDVTVLNIAGCGNGTPPPANPVAGTSPVLVRLIQKYP